MAGTTITLVHAFAVAASLNWATYLTRAISTSPKFRHVWLAITPGFVAPIWTGGSNVMLIAMSCTAVVCAATSTVVAMKPYLTNVIKLSLVGGPYIAHTVLAVLSAFYHNDTSTHWTSVVGSAVSPVLVLGVLLFT